MKRHILILALLSLGSLFCLAQDKELGDKEYVIVKDYKPVLADSYKISDTPEGDSTSSNPPKLNYNIVPKKLETNFESGVIKAAKIKDEPIPKLYHTLVKLGLGNYNTYYAEGFYNALRSKTSQLGVHLYHLSGEPKLKDVSKASFSNNAAEAYGKYFLDKATIDGIAGFDRRSMRFYGVDKNFYIIDNDSTKQHFNHLHVGAGMKSNHIDDTHIDYHGRVEFHSLSDNYDVTENNFIVYGGAAKKFDENYFGLDVRFDYFKKTDAEFEKLDLNSNLARNIVTASPYFKRDFDKISLQAGFHLAVEKNVGSIAHFYPDVSVSVPIAEHVVYIFGDVTGNLEPKNYRTVTDENPFTTPAVKLYKNQSNDIVIDGGLKGNISSQVSFLAMVKYSSVSGMVLFYNDSLFPYNTFNVIYDAGTVFNIHGELGYRNSEKLNLSAAFDYYTYDMNREPKAWHKPNYEGRLMAKYNLKDKIQLNATLLASGTRYARTISSDSLRIEPKKIKGYVDFNLGVEYRYSKVLSFYMNLNNLFFSRYEQWYGYPSEKFNLLGGLTYSF